jgi:hypothetical protein
MGHPGRCGPPFFAVKVDPECSQEFRGGSLRGLQVRRPIGGVKVQ